MSSASPDASSTKPDTATRTENLGSPLRLQTPKRIGRKTRTVPHTHTDNWRRGETDRQTDRQTHTHTHTQFQMFLVLTFMDTESLCLGKSCIITSAKGPVLRLPDSHSARPRECTALPCHCLLAHPLTSAAPPCLARPPCRTACPRLFGSSSN